MSLDEIRKLPSTTITMTLECAGNGRAFFDPPVAGIQWAKGAVGTARWTGVRLAEVLKRAGAKSTARFVYMNGADRPLGTMPDFVRQLPIEKATHPDTILAYDMNGQPITPLHGFPLRAIVPGWEGAYSIKWLTSLRVADRESDSWVATDTAIRQSASHRGHGRSQGHGAADRAGRQVAHHPSTGRRGGRARQG